LNINPGDVSSFPLLSRLATMFESYEFLNLNFSFKSLVTEGNQTANGSIIMTPIHNPSASVLINKRSLENTTRSASCKLTKNSTCNFISPTSHQALSGRKYVRQTDVESTDGNINTYDIGFLLVTTSECVPNLQIGELWTDYTVRLSKLRPLEITTQNKVGDGMFLQFNFPPQGSEGLYNESLFGTKDGTTISTITPPGPIGRNSLYRITPSWTNCSIFNKYIPAGTDVPFGGVWTSVTMSIPIASGEKYLTTLTISGNSVYGWGEPFQNFVTDVVVYPEPGPKHGATINFNETMSVQGIGHPQDISRFSQSLIINILTTFEKSSPVELGEMSYEYIFKWLASPANREEFNFGFTSLSVMKVNDNYILPINMQS